MGVLYWYCMDAPQCSGSTIPCNRECYPSSSGTDTGSGTSAGTVTFTTKSGSNSWWLAFTVAVTGGDVEWLKMKDSTMSSWETGVSEWNYFKFTGNTPYSAPFHFKVEVSGAEYEAYNVISSISEGDSGTITLSSAFLAEDESTSSSERLTSGELVAIVLSACLVSCLLMALCVVCYRRRNKAIVAGVDSIEEDEDVIGGSTTQ